jgi:hypothetical protein
LSKETSSDTTQEEARSHTRIRSKDDEVRASEGDGLGVGVRDRIKTKSGIDKRHVNAQENRRTAEANHRLRREKTGKRKKKE